MNASRQDKSGTGVFYSFRYRGLAAQMLILALTVLVLGYFGYNAVLNTSMRSIGIGFDFLWRESGFSIGQSIIPFRPTDTYFMAFVVGVINTIRVSLVGILLATILGFLVGAGAQSSNRSIQRVCIVYVEIFRNIPLLLQLYFWYSIILNLFPSEKSAFSLFSAVFISKAGIVVPRLGFSVIDGLGIGCLLLIAMAAWIVMRRRAAKGAVLRHRPSSLSILLVVAAFAWAYFVPVEYPEFKRFGFVGGLSVSAEFLAVAFGLSTYTASFIAEIVRAGIAAVPSGQLEAAQSLGLTSGQTLFLVRIPQALRLVIPPLTSQYLNLTKNSSLAVAIGYADLVSVANTSLTQTARAIECIAIVMAVYLTLSLLTSLVMNVYNRRLMLRTGQG